MAPLGSALRFARLAMTRLATTRLAMTPLAITTKGELPSRRIRARIERIRSMEG